MMSGPFDDLTAVQRRQFREAQIAAKRRERWGVFVRDPRDGRGWEERHRWINGNLAELADRDDAEARASEIRQLHPGWEVEARLTDNPLPGTFREAFAPLLSHEEG